MQGKTSIQRILKSFGKAMAWVLLLLGILVLLIHIPLVQDKVGDKLSAYLSRKFQSKVEIGQLRFSLAGRVRAGDLRLFDPEQEEVIAIGYLDVKANIFDLLAGRYQIDHIHLKKVTGRYDEYDHKSNLQFLFAAFPKSDTPTDTTNPISISIRNIQIEDLDFEYASTTDSQTLDIIWKSLILSSFSYQSITNKLSADSITIDGVDVQFLSRAKGTTSDTTPSPLVIRKFYPAFGTGLDIAVNAIMMHHGRFAFHQDTVMTTEDFDPDHVEVSDIHIDMVYGVMNPDTFNVELKDISALLAGLDTVHLQAVAGMNPNAFELSQFHLASAHNQVNFHLSAWPDQDTLQPLQAKLEMNASLTPALLHYFTKDAYRTYTDHLRDIRIALAGSYKKGKGELSSMAMTTSESSLGMKGTIYGLENVASLKWERLNINAQIGNDGKRIVTLLAGDLPLPPSIRLSALSTGHPKKFNLNGLLITSWGNLNANGSVIPARDGLNLDVQLQGDHIQAGQWIEQSWLGNVDASIHASGYAGRNMNLAFDGNISSMTVMENDVRDIDIDGWVRPDSIQVTADIHDPTYTSRIVSTIYPSDPIQIIAQVETDSLDLGHLLKMDTAFLVSGEWKGRIDVSDTLLLTDLHGRQIMMTYGASTYALDSMSWSGDFSPTNSEISYEAPDASVSIHSNFDLMDWPEQWSTWNDRLLFDPGSIFLPEGTKKLEADILLRDEALLAFAGITVDTFSNLTIRGDLDEAVQAFQLSGQSGTMGISGISLDTMQTEMSIYGDSLTAAIEIEGLGFKTSDLGHFSWTANTHHDTLKTHLSLLRDSVTMAKWESRILSNADQILVYTDALVVMDTPYVHSNQSPIIHQGGNYVFDQFMLSHGDMSLQIDGDTSAINAELKNLDLTRLNSMLFKDSMIIGQGMLGVNLSYRRNSQFEFHAAVDSLRVYGSDPLQLRMNATTEKDEVPFLFEINNPGNSITLEGRYAFNSQQVNAKGKIDLTDPDLFLFLLDDYVSTLTGHISGEADIRGPLLQPSMKGHLRFDDTEFETIRPRVRLGMTNEEISFTDTSMVLNDFKLLDRHARPLTINGHLKFKPTGAYAYDLRFTADRFTLMQPETTHEDDLSGLLIIGTDTRLSGTENDTYIQSSLTIDDSTSLVYAYGSAEDDLIETAGIVEFVDPDQLRDTGVIALKMSAYDSLVAALPDFNLNADIRVQEKATLRIVVDQNSGDYIEASGGARLELGYDRTGNLHLAGNYILTNGVYSLSFYNLVKKNFALVPGSSIRWSGNPRTGDLDIKAEHTVQSNSLGLIGNEISENEKSVYKRSLGYIIGIHIKGILEKPNVYFTLDLPEVEKANYPVLASKLQRLKQPEFQSELNKQVFGLLALGGFLPESSGSDVNSTQIATTALYNSVNSVLSAQLNRFASQHLKGVNIDVGIQSYNDYSSAGSGTKTAMDFRVSKSILDDRLSFEVGGDFDLNADQSGTNTGDNYRGDIAIIYDLTGNNDKQLKLFNNESYDIVYQEIRNTGISLIFIREFNKGERVKKKKK